MRILRERGGGYDRSRMSVSLRQANTKLFTGKERG